MALLTQTPPPRGAGGPAMSFAFSDGDTPLDGYTIRKPLGHGGFGDVYHATSDAGKDVALKVVERHMDVELRGVGHCLNLKHQNLVTLFDVRADAAGRQWIVMEYVDGPTLADVLDRRPDGVPVEEALRWLEGIAAAVEHLHASGIVHRDLKPGNIFDDHGTVKVGDYGLAKFITASRRSAQTQSVGTVHYMAPEVGSGRYGREVDVYAVGIMLYELLTGRVPFDGETPAEILMKHLTATPDLSALPPAFRGVAARMLAKNPHDRYGSVGAALSDLRARLADAALAGDAEDESGYPSYEESIVSRPGVSDWLESPLDMLRQVRPANVAGPKTGSAARDSSGGSIGIALRRHPFLTAFCALLVLLVPAGTVVHFFAPEGRAGRGMAGMYLILLLDIIPAMALAAVGCLLRFFPEGTSPASAVRARPLASAFCLFLCLIPPIGTILVYIGPGGNSNLVIWLLFAIIPSVALAVVGLLMRSLDAQAAEPERSPRQSPVLRRPPQPHPPRVDTPLHFGATEIPPSVDERVAAIEDQMQARRDAAAHERLRTGRGGIGLVGVAIIGVASLLLLGGFTVLGWPMAFFPAAGLTAIVVIALVGGLFRLRPAVVLGMMLLLLLVLMSLPIVMDRMQQRTSTGAQPVRMHDTIASTPDEAATWPPALDTYRYDNPAGFSFAIPHPRDSWTTDSGGEHGSLWFKFQSTRGEQGIHVRQVRPADIPTTPRAPEWIAAVHAGMREFAAAEFATFEERTDTLSSEGPGVGTAETEFTGFVNGVGEIRGLRRTIVQGEFGLSFVCYTTPAAWGKYSSLFEQIVRDVEITPPAESTTEPKRSEDAAH